MTLTFFLLNLTLGNLSEPGYKHALFNLDHDRTALELTIHTEMGCLIRFSRPFDDAWSSDNSGNATGEFYKFARWGTDASGNPLSSQLMISSVRFTETPQNLFVMVDGQPIEIVLKQTKDADAADRRVYLEVAGGKPQAFLPKPEKKVRKDATPALPLGRRGNKSTLALNGRIIYNLRGKPFVLYTPKTGLPPLEKVEVVRGKKRRFSKNFAFEVPVSAVTYDINGSILIELPPYTLAAGEHLYLRVKHTGDRTAKTKRLRKKGWRWWRS